MICRYAYQFLQLAEFLGIYELKNKFLKNKIYNKRLTTVWIEKINKSTSKVVVEIEF